METLPAEFKQNGFSFSQLKRSGMVALFSKTKPHFQSTFYEVVIIQTMPEHAWPNGNVTPEHELMPPSESWGKLGWSFHNTDLEGAQRKFRELTS